VYALLIPTLLAAAPADFSLLDDGDRRSLGRASLVESLEPPAETVEAIARRARRKPRRRAARRRPQNVTVPIDIGVGPMAVVPNPPVFDDQIAHFALTLSAGAIIDQELIRKNRDKIPRQYRKYVSNVGRVTIRPLWVALIPEVIMVSPGSLLGLSNTDLYGAIWHPIGIGVAPSKGPVYVHIGAKLSVLGGYLQSPLANSGTVLLRPGLGLVASAEIPLGERAAFSLGWMSDFFIPQPVGGEILEIEPIEQSLWHLGGPFLKFHFRIPYQTRI
jgi:hypothetical protein